MSERSTIAASPDPAAPTRVLLVDDHPLNRKLCATLLEHAGYDVVLASDGAEAVALATKGGIDVVLMDVHMPHMDGFEATQRIRGLEGPAAMVPIIALTADTPVESEARVREAGMCGVLSKPIQVPELLAAIVAAARQHRG